MPPARGHGECVWGEGLVCAIIERLCAHPQEYRGLFPFSCAARRLKSASERNNYGEPPARMHNRDSTIRQERAPGA